MIVYDQDFSVSTDDIYDKFVESAAVGYNKEIVNNNLAVPLTILAVLFLLSRA